jgi:hypothetical protein
MTLEQLITKLLRLNMDATVKVIVHNKSEDFTICFGGGEGVSMRDCESVSFYVDRLCSSETKREGA